MVKFDFAGKSVLVTGAAGAIGKGIAAEFCRSGATVFITDLRPDAVAAAVAELSCGRARLPRPGSRRHAGRPGAAVVAAAAAAASGRVDILVNVAGIVGQGKVEEISEADWERIFAVNCKGTFLFIT